MYISLKEILKNEMFKDVLVVAGANGLERKVQRVSVFDCPCNRRILESDIIKEGDLFISCLEQFKYDENNIYEFINVMLKANCSGLFIVSEDCIEAITEKAVKICNENNFPVLLTKEEIPYAAIMDAVNKYIAVDNLNVINTLKLEKILYGNELANEKMEILYSINPDVRQFLRVIDVDGEFNSDIAQVELHTEYLNRSSDIFVRGKNHMVFILSDDEVKKLKHHTDATTVKFAEFLENPIMGYSRIYNRKDVAKALEEARRSLETAKTMKINTQTYDPLSVMQLLLALKDTQEAHDFYYAYVEAIKKNVSAEAVKETLITMETFVANSGNYSETAKLLSQHENTIRYRVNKVKSALNMEKDNVKFNETVAVAVKLRTLINERL